MGGLPIWGYYKPVITHICKKCNIFMQNLILTIFSAYVIIQADDREGTFAATKRTVICVRTGCEISVGILWGSYSSLVRRYA